MCLVCFISSKLKWLLVSGNGYLQRDSVGEVGMLYEDGELTFKAPLKGRQYKLQKTGERNCIKCLKKGWNGKKWSGNKNIEKWLGHVG